MCGICGLLAPSGTADPALAGRMNSSLVHRGPDDGSVDGFGRCVLGHRRLRVIDLATGDQPVSSENGAVVAVFNGEIYNFAELRAGLAAQGHTVRGTGDTPVLPHLYEEHGPAFVGRLSGMFALALWDSERERLVLARDRVGKKPLLWTRLPDGTIAWASELKALLRLPGVSCEPDPAALDAYLALQYVPGELTGLRAVRKLLPGHVLVAEGGKVSIERYWRVTPSGETRSDSEWLELVRSRVRDAVRRRLIADVPLGALLSGGIDSSVVVALMAEASRDPVRTFTVGFGEPRYDERAYARATAERYATDHEELVLAADPDALPRLARVLDEPLGDEAALPLFLICEAARRRVTVALTGDGGDEAFAGYERYLAHALGRYPGVGLAPVGALRFLGRRDPRSGLNRLARLAETARTPREERYGGLMEVFPAPLRAELWEPGFVAHPIPAAQLLGQPRFPGTAGLQALDIETYLPGDLLLKADLSSMASSLELRSPLLDHEVLELGISLPDSLRRRGRRGKEALRRAFAGELPREVAGRGKKGFGVPLARWFRGELRTLAADVLLDATARGRGQLRPETVKRLLDEHVGGRADHGHRLWCLVMLELWQRTFLDAGQEAPQGTGLLAARA